MFWLGLGIGIALGALLAILIGIFLGIYIATYPLLHSKEIEERILEKSPHNAERN